MKLKNLVTTLLATLLVVGVANNTQAAEKKSKEAPKGEKKKGGAYPFRGKIASADKAAMTITIAGKEKQRVIKITSETRIVKGGKPATFDDAKAGEEVGGTVKKDADGKEVAATLRVGPAPEGKGKGGEKKKKDKK